MESIDFAPEEIHATGAVRKRPAQRGNLGARRTINKQKNLGVRRTIIKQKNCELIPRPLASATPLTVGTWCSGLEAIILACVGLNLPFSHVFAADNDAAAQATIKYNYSPTCLRGDVTKHKPEDWDACSVFHAGFPCQSFSTQGNHQGIRDRRGKIVHHILKLIKHHHFRVILLENVKGLVTLHNKTLQFITNRLIQMGYRVFSRVLNARFSGVPQNRERLFIIAVLNDYCAQNEFPWPEDLPEVRLKTILDAKTLAEKQRDLDFARPPLSQSHARTSVNECYKQMRANNLDPASTSMVIDVDSSHPTMMFNCSPCLTRSRAGAGGHWVTCRGRRFTISEMQRLMGIGLQAPDGSRVQIEQPQEVSDRQWAMLLGNAIPVPILQRLLARLMTFAKFSTVPVADIWEANA